MSFLTYWPIRDLMSLALRYCWGVPSTPISLELSLMGLRILSFLFLAEDQFIQQLNCWDLTVFTSLSWSCWVSPLLAWGCQNRYPPKQVQPEINHILDIILVPFRVVHTINLTLFPRKQLYYTIILNCSMHRWKQCWWKNQPNININIQKQYLLVLSSVVWTPIHAPYLGHHGLRNVQVQAIQVGRCPEAVFPGAHWKVKIIKFSVNMISVV